MEPGRQPARLDLVGRAVQDLGVVERGDAATRGSAAGPRPRPEGVDRPRSPAPPRVPALAERRRADMTPTLELAVALDGEQRPEQRHAAHEVVGAVDRVDVPADPAGAGLGAVLLADEAVVGVGAQRSARGSAARWPGRPASRTSGLAWSRSTRSRRKCVHARRVGLVAARRAANGQPARSQLARGGSSSESVSARIRLAGRVVQRLARDLEADPLAEHLDLAARPDRGPVRRQVGVGDRALDREAVAARRHPADDRRRRPGPARCRGRPSAGRRGRGSASRLRGPAAFAATSASRPMKSALVERDREPEARLVRRLVRRDVARPDAIALLEPERVDRPVAGRRPGRARCPASQSVVHSARPYSVGAYSSQPSSPTYVTRKRGDRHGPDGDLARGEVRERRAFERSSRRDATRGCRGPAGPTARSTRGRRSRRAGPTEPSSGRCWRSQPGRGCRTRSRSRSGSGPAARRVTVRSASIPPRRLSSWV